MKLKIIMMFVCVFLLSFNVFAGEKNDHSDIYPIPGSKMTIHRYNNYANFTYFYKNDNGLHKARIRGRYWKLTYDLYNGYSESDIMNYFRKRETGRNGDILLQDGNKMTYTLPILKGGHFWVQLTVFKDGRSYELSISEESPKVRFYTAEGIMRTLLEHGYIIIPEINFKHDSFELNNETEKILKVFVKMMNMYKNAKIEVRGFTDSTGDKKYNKLLSNKRAFNVKSYIVSYGIESLRLEANGYGESAPIASNETSSGRFANRRVEFRLIK